MGADLVLASPFGWVVTGIVWAVVGLVAWLVFRRNKTSDDAVLEAFRTVTGWPDELVLHYADEHSNCSCAPICGGRGEEMDCPVAQAIWDRSTT